MMNNFNQNNNYPVNNSTIGNRSFSLNRYTISNKNENPLYINTTTEITTTENNNRNYIRNNITPNSQRINSEVWDKTRGPYGVRFDEMDIHTRIGQKQYRDDLEYLMSLKNERHGDMTQKEWEAYNRKLHYMNDVSKFFIYI